MGEVELSCIGCGAPFVGEDWMTHCWHCFKKKKKEEQRQDYDQGFREGYRLAVREREQAPSLDADLLRALIRLAHPDKHPPERSRECNDVTARLLELRGAR